MSILSGDEILRLIKSGRLVLVPLLQPARQITKVGVDLRLGSRFIVSRRTGSTEIDPVQSGGHHRLRADVERFLVPLGQRFVLHPGMQVLGCTLEYLSFPPNLVGFAEARSSWGRAGLTILTQPTVTPGYKGILTLQLSNAGPVPIVLYPGMRVIHLSIHELDESAEQASQEGVQTAKYYCATEPEVSKLFEDPETRCLRQKQLMLIGLTGPKESGKTSAADYMVRNLGFVRVSLAHILRRHALVAGIEPDEAALIELGEDVRRFRGLSYLADSIIAQMVESASHPLIVIDSFRHPAEMHRLAEFASETQSMCFFIGFWADYEERLKRRMGTDSVNQDEASRKEEFRRLDSLDRGIQGRSEQSSLMYTDTQTVDISMPSTQVDNCLKLLTTGEPGIKGHIISTTGLGLEELHGEIDLCLLDKVLPEAYSTRSPAATRLAGLIRR